MHRLAAAADRAQTRRDRRDGAGRRAGGGPVGRSAAQAGPATDVIEGARAQVRALEAELTRHRPGGGAPPRPPTPTRTRARRRRAGADRARRAGAARGPRRPRATRSSASRDRLVAIYTVASRPSLVEVLLTSGGLTETVDAQRALEAIGDGDAAPRGEPGAPPRARLARVARRAADQPRGGRGRPSRRRRAHGRAGGAAERAAARCSSAPARPSTGSWPGRPRARPPAARRAARGRRGGRRRPRRGGAAAPGGPGLRRRRPPRRPPRPPRHRRRGPAPAAAADPARRRPGAPRPGAALDRIAQCESGGDPRAVSASGQYRGKYQFDPGHLGGARRARATPPPRPRRSRTGGRPCSTPRAAPRPGPSADTGRARGAIGVSPGTIRPLTHADGAQHSLVLADRGRGQERHASRVPSALRDHGIGVGIGRPPWGHRCRVPATCRSAAYRHGPDSTPRGNGGG